MRIGFDAKRAFYNSSGLGNYSRDTIRSLYQHFPSNEYHLYTPAINRSLFQIDSSPNLYICTPYISHGKIGQAYWRSFSISNRLKADHINIYHGLSNELPYGIEKAGIKTVVTIHDLIFMHHPEWYNPVDRYIYERKFRTSSIKADRVVSVSRQTCNDLVQYFGVDEKKIEIIYQGCNEEFGRKLSVDEKNSVKTKWNLPETYILYVGTVEERKNLLNVVRAIHEGNIDIPLVAVGRHTGYAASIMRYIKSHNLKNVHFLKEVPVTDLPGIYQLAKVFIYPSLFEGFGIPILEALTSGVPVITSKGGCFDEVGGTHSLYVDPLNTSEIGSALEKVLNDTALQTNMKNAGYAHTKLFSGERSAQQLYSLYTDLMNE
jgi:glycosyltransferase involved in cell wall biosynthesis